MIIKIDKNRPLPMYVQIRDEIKRLIKEGRFNPHEKLPPSRELAKSLNISRNTVIQSYSLLEAEGFVYSVTGKGTFVNPRSIKKVQKKPDNYNEKRFNLESLFSIAWRRFEASVMSGLEKLTSYDNFKDYITFDSPNPDIETLPIENFRNSLINSIKKYGAQLFSSEKTEGFYQFREYLSKYMLKRGIYSNPDNILITSGIQQGLSIIGRLLIDPGDTVVLENLSYPGALSVFRSIQAHYIGVPGDKEGMNINILEKILKRKKVKLLYTIPTYQNPRGSVLSLDRRKALVELSEKYGFAIIEDDYAYELSFTGIEEIPIKAFDVSGNIFYMGSFSESLFPGIRLSWIIAPKQIVKKLSSLKKSEDIYTNLILQAAVLDFMEKGYFNKHLKQFKKILAKRYEVLNYALTRYLPSEAKWNSIKGGPYRWIDLPSDIDSLDLLLKTREKGVLFAPDRIFAVEDLGHSGFRLKFSNVNEDKIWRGIEIIGNTLKSMLSGG